MQCCAGRAGLFSTAHPLPHTPQPLDLHKRRFQIQPLLWWHCFLHRWNRRSLFMAHLSDPPTITILKTPLAPGDAEQFGISTGCKSRGHLRGKPQIGAKELVAVLLAIGVWGRHWHVLVQCDNMAVVEVMKAKTSHDKLLMHMVRSLHFLIHISAQHIL